MMGPSGRYFWLTAACWRLSAFVRHYLPGAIAARGGPSVVIKAMVHFSIRRKVQSTARSSEN
jgi:hypothetical protein